MTPVRNNCTVQSKCLDHSEILKSTVTVGDYFNAAEKLSIVLFATIILFTAKKKKSSN